jgi:hypothetical protein
MGGRKSFWGLAQYTRGPCTKSPSDSKLRTQDSKPKGWRRRNLSNSPDIKGASPWLVSGVASIKTARKARSSISDFGVSDLRWAFVRLPILSAARHVSYAAALAEGNTAAATLYPPSRSVQSASPGHENRFAGYTESGADHETQILPMNSGACF